MTGQPDKIAIIAAPLPILIAEEVNVLRELADGAQDKQIASRLGIGRERVKRIEQKLRYELYARNRSHLVAIAIRYGLIENPNPHPRPSPPGARKAPYAYHVLPREAQERLPPHSRIVAVVAVRPHLWTIKRGTLVKSATGVWEDMPSSLTPEWLATHTWTLEQAFRLAREIVLEQQESARSRAL